MKLSENKLLDNYKCISNSGAYISVINGAEYFWSYGYICDHAWVETYREKAEYIKVTRIYGYNLKILDLAKREPKPEKLDKVEIDRIRFYNDLGD